MYSKIAAFASLLVAKMMSPQHSSFKVAQKLSIIALS
jgi:hypothetical protein